MHGMRMDGFNWWDCVRFVLVYFNFSFDAVVVETCYLDADKGLVF